MNLRLRYAIDAAKAVSMPKDNIQRAIKRGTGELEGGNFEEILYEGYGAGGVAVLCEILTDNRNRTAGEIRKIFEMADGKLGATGCVAWMFERKGLFLVAGRQGGRRQAVGTGRRGRRRRRQARSTTSSRVTCDPAVFGTVADALRPPASNRKRRRSTRIPTSTVDLE